MHIGVTMLFHLMKNINFPRKKGKLCTIQRKLTKAELNLSKLYLIYFMKPILESTAWHDKGSRSSLHNGI